jgi:phage terminase large subunit GpA-like protein
MDAFCDDNNEQVVVMSSAQIGKSSIIENIIGYFVDLDPSPIMLIQPTLGMAEAFSKDRIAPMIRDTPCLTSKFADPRSRDSGNTLLHKQFLGGHITLVGANSAADLASRPIRILLADEVDRFPASAGTEGDPISLGLKRTATFHNRRIGMFSTPTVRGVSRIERAFEQSDKRHFYVPCPHCKTLQPLIWDNVKWVLDEDSGKIIDRHVWYECEECGGRIEQTNKRGMLAAGEWVPRSSFSGIAGFHINELYSPWRRWIDIVEDYLRAKDNTQALQVWINTSLGLPYEEQGDKIEENIILARREFYDHECPDGVLCITAGIDLQVDRLEVYVIGWGLGEEMWYMDYHNLRGTPEHGEVWEDLNEVLAKRYKDSKGAKVPITTACIDSGYATQSVYNFIISRRSGGARLFAVKGVPGNGKPIASSPKLIRTKSGHQIRICSVGVDEAKLRIMHAFQKDSPGPHYVHIPAAEWADAEFAAQISAEALVLDRKGGQASYRWKKRRDRNEALDCTVYSLAGLHLSFAGRPEEAFRRMANPEEKKGKIVRRPRSTGIQ